MENTNSRWRLFTTLNAQSRLSWKRSILSKELLFSTCPQFVLNGHHVKAAPLMTFGVHLDLVCILSSPLVCFYHISVVPNEHNETAAYPAACDQSKSQSQCPTSGDDDELLSCSKSTSEFKARELILYRALRVPGFWRALAGILQRQP